jgi:hypothetical protein
LYLGYTSIVTGKLSCRQKKVFEYLRGRYPEWGRKSDHITVLYQQQEKKNDGWKPAEAAASTAQHSTMDGKRIYH